MEIMFYKKTPGIGCHQFFSNDISAVREELSRRGFTTGFYEDIRDGGFVGIRINGDRETVMAIADEVARAATVALYGNSGAIFDAIVKD